MRKAIITLIFEIFILESLSASTFRPQSESDWIDKAEYLCAFKILDRQSDERSDVFQAETIRCFIGDLPPTVRILAPQKIRANKDNKTVTRIPGSPQIRSGENLILSLQIYSREPLTLFLKSWDVRRLEEQNDPNNSGKKTYLLEEVENSRIHSKSGPKQERRLDLKAFDKRVRLIRKTR